MVLIGFYQTACVTQAVSLRADNRYQLSKKTTLSLPATPWMVLPLAVFGAKTLPCRSNLFKAGWTH